VTKRVFGFAGWSGSGKTTLIEQVIAHLAADGVRVALIKHAHHSFDIDHIGKDSHRHREAGATEVMISSGKRWAIMHELRGAPELSLAHALERLSPCDLVLIEGYKREPLPKLEVWRSAVGKPLLFPEDEHIIALATDDPLPADASKELDALAAREPNFVRVGLANIAAIAQLALLRAATL
jgi:molybdopterin-guanine dinucleotide biosynthesis adapter protein